MFRSFIYLDEDNLRIYKRQIDGKTMYNPRLYLRKAVEYDSTTISAMRLLRICSGFEIPEASDVVNPINQFMPMLMGQIETESAGEQEALEGILGKVSADIPFRVECDDVTIFGELNARYLREEYASLEDYADQDVYMLCKVVGMMRKDMVEIFDSLKDFSRLPRTMRRQMTANGKSVGLDKISIEGPVLKVEVIAIYK